MIAVFVGDENPINFFGARAAERFEAPQHFFFAEAGVNQESGAPRFEQCGVAGAARRQNGYAKRDTLPPRCASTTANGCARHRNGMMAKCRAGVNTNSRESNCRLRSFDGKDGGDGASLLDFLRKQYERWLQCSRDCHGLCVSIAAYKFHILRLPVGYIQ